MGWQLVHQRLALELQMLHICAFLCLDSTIEDDDEKNSQ